MDVSGLFGPGSDPRAAAAAGAGRPDEVGGGTGSITFGITGCGVRHPKAEAFFFSASPSAEGSSRERSSA